MRPAGAESERVMCPACDDFGLVPFLPHDSPVADADVKTADMHFAVCLCSYGQAFRLDVNEGHKVAPQWRLWCARYQVDPSRVVMLEHAYTANDLAAAGFSKPVASINREAAMLAAGRRKK